ncbi:hypothetical protein GS397_23740 [Sphingobium yanoikuyae]|uniref:AlgX/AlgJ SGNH hydrolase-like domain-containing protein n=1 Tax=Sphingobium yanoikuyae TaxID=13690 RepID=A0A6P1GMD2_SPHYA|nr:hypothetical protein [Sphingobium yanoikuyae]QHD69747.1 hypothetical protein GS397_23740 [Sphingobium yanoikuyae]
MLVEGSVINNTLIGKNEWLYLWQGGQRQFDFLTSRSSPSPQSITNFLNNIEDRVKFCQNNDIRYIHIVYPSKPVVMPENLPEFISGEVRSLFKRCYEDFIKKCLTESVLYPLDSLVKEKNSAPVFRQYDTHMTDYGNAIVSREILRHLGENHDPLLFFKSQPQNRIGDLAKMADVKKTVVENALKSISNVDQSWDNRAFLPGNTDNVVIVHNPNSASDKRLLALGDSFLRDGLSSLSTFYRDILYIRSDLFQKDAIALFAPDAIISANAERYMCQISSDSDADGILLKCYGRANYHPSDAYVAAFNAQIGYRAYPKRYQNWAKKIKSLSFEGIGVGEPNNQIDFSDIDNGYMISSGTDPQIIINESMLDKELSYKLIFSIDSQHPGIFQIFYDNENNDKLFKFNEENSIKFDIKNGKNIFECNIPKNRNSNSIRIDPVNFEGYFRINYLTAHLNFCD